MKAAEVHGARAGFCCRSGAGDTAAAEAATEAATEAAVEAATGAAVEAATGAAVEAATGTATKVTAAAVCCGSVQGATEVAVVSGARAECSGRSGAGGTAATAAEESCASWSRRAAIPEQEGKSGAILFSYKFIRTLLALASKVAVGELVAIEVLMYTTVRSIKDGEREARQASNMDFIGGEARGGANGVVTGILWYSLQTMANV